MKNKLIIPAKIVLLLIIIYFSYIKYFSKTLDLFSIYNTIELSNNDKILNENDLKYNIISTHKTVDQYLNLQKNIFDHISSRSNLKILSFKELENKSFTTKTKVNYFEIIIESDYQNLLITLLEIEKKIDNLAIENSIFYKNKNNINLKLTLTLL